MKETLSFNKDWRFHLGDIPVEEAKLKSPMYIEAKTGPQALRPRRPGIYGRHGVL